MTLKKICVSAHSDSPGSQLQALAEWYRLTGSLTELVFAELSETHLGISPAEFTYADKAARYIADNYTKKLTVTDVAEYLGISRGYLHSIFKKAKGMGVIEYLNKHRISSAIQLILEKGMTLNEAAVNTGIDDPAYMSRLFKKTTGITYRDYISQNITQNR